MIGALLRFLTRLLTGVQARSAGFAFEPPAQRLYYANHSSHLDTLIIWTLIPDDQRRRTRPAAAQDYWWSSPLRRYIAEQVLNAVPVVREKSSPEQDPLEGLRQALTAGDSLIFFPEGTRGSGDQIAPFKSGLYRLAIEFPQLQLVPVYIDNLNRVLPKGEMLPVPLICSALFGAPLRPDEGESRQDFLQRARAALLQLSGDA